MLSMQGLEHKSKRRPYLERRTSSTCPAMNKPLQCVPVSDRPYVKNHCLNFWGCVKGVPLCKGRNCAQTDSYVGRRATCRIPKSLLVDVEGWLKVVTKLKCKHPYDKDSSTDKNFCKHMRKLSKEYMEDKDGAQTNKAQAS